VSARLLFDECIGKPIVVCFGRLLELAHDDEKAELTHVLDFQKQGIWDEVWVPQIKSEGRIVITGDGGRGGVSKGEKLPRLCARYGITHVILSPKMHVRKSFRKMISVLSVWHQIITLNEVDPGSRHFLEPLGDNTGKLVKKAIPERDEPPAGPGMLFNR
jgi:hypothetical protein